MEVGFLFWLNSTFYDGLPYALVTLSFVITYRYLRFPDLTCTGSFVLASAVAAHCVIGLKIAPILAVLIGCLAGAGAGAFTALLHTGLRLDPILSGIISSFCLYSINLLLLRPTIAYGDAATILTRWEQLDRSITWNQIAWHPWSIGALILVIGVVKLLLDRFLRSELGLSIRSLEDERAGENVLLRHGISVSYVKTAGLMLANAIVGLAGVITSMKEGAANVHRGLDVLVTGMIAYLIGVQINRIAVGLARKRGLQPTTAVIGGACAYFGLVSGSYSLAVPPEIMRLLLGTALALSMGRWRFSERIMRYGRSTPELHATTHDAKPVLQLVGCVYRYPTAEVDTVRNLSLEVQFGEVVELKGSNGTGKTTALRLIAGHLSSPQRGTIRLQGVDVTAAPEDRLRQVAYVEQNPTSSVARTLDVMENLVLAGLSRFPVPWKNALTVGRVQQVESMFSAADFPTSFLRRKADQLSGGQLQVINVGSLLAHKALPSVLLLDEPLNQLDSTHRLVVEKLIRTLQKSGASIVIASHQPYGMSPDRVLEMSSPLVGASAGTFLKR